MNNGKLLVFLNLAVFTLFAFALGRDAGTWRNGPADKIGFLIHAFAALVFCAVLVRQIHKLKDV
jgi:hypothetical protein